MDLPKEGQENIDRNRELWQDRARWEGDLAFGEKWSGATHCRVVAERYLRPFLPERGVDATEDPRDELDILEISPGAGRFTIELLRFAKSIVLVDLNQACIDLCRERFRYHTDVSYVVNDGTSLASVGDDRFDLIASWDSFVHMERSVVRAYVSQFAAKLRAGGLAWIHHSAAGESDLGWRSNMTAALMREYAAGNGLLMRAQLFRWMVDEPQPHFNDCISVLEKP